MTDPKVSVVMSVYNGLPYLEAAVMSILKQTFTDFEFVILDDGSTDSTWKALQEYAAQDARIRLFSNESNMGYTRSLNAGFKQARGKYIARQDADDISLPERLEQQVALLDAHPEIGLAGTRRQFIDPQDELLDIPDKLTATDNASIQALLLDINCIHHGSFMFRRELLDVIGDYTVELEPSEDYDFCLRAAEVAQLANLSDALYLYRVHPTSVSKLKEYRQAYNKALGLEHAIFRRHGPHPPVDNLAIVGRDYLRAAILAFAGGQLDEASTTLQHGLSLYPIILDTDEPLASMLTWYSPGELVEDKLVFMDAVFDALLPKTTHLARLKSRMVSQIHMSEVFSAANQHKYGNIGDHLWPGLRADPSWLLNRGVIAIILTQMLAAYKSNSDG
jgi:glycosyltransferase involved in cell wall biosynthesis